MKISLKCSVLVCCFGHSRRRVTRETLTHRGASVQYGVRLTEGASRTRAEPFDPSSGSGSFLTPDGLWLANMFKRGASRAERVYESGSLWSVKPAPEKAIKSYSIQILFFCFFKGVYSLRYDYRCLFRCVCLPLARSCYPPDRNTLLFRRRKPRNKATHRLAFY